MNGHARQRDGQKQSAEMKENRKDGRCVDDFHYLCKDCMKNLSEGEKHGLHKKRKEGWRSAKGKMSNLLAVRNEGRGGGGKEERGSNLSIGE